MRGGGGGGGEINGFASQEDSDQPRHQAPRL